MANVYCIVNESVLLSTPTRKIYLQEPLAYSNANAHAMQVTVFNDDGSEMDLTGVGVVGNFKKSDGNTVTPITGTVDGNVARVILSPSCYVTPGRYVFTMDLTDLSNTTRTVLWVEGMVEKNISGTIIDPGTPVGNIDQAIGNANAAASAANTAAEAATQAAATAQEVADNVEGDVSALKRASNKFDSTLTADKSKIAVTVLGTGYITSDGIYGASSNWTLGVISSELGGGDIIDISSKFSAINAFAAKKCQYTFFDIAVTASNYTTVDVSHVLGHGTPQSGTDDMTLAANDVVIPDGTVSLVVSTAAGYEHTFDVKLHKHFNLSETKSIVDDLKVDMLSIKNNYDIGFNHFDGTYVENYQWSNNKSISEGAVYDTTTVSTKPIPVGSTTHLRFRSNQPPIRVYSYDSTGAFVKASNWNAYAIDFVQNGYVIFSYLKTNFNPSTLMIAYTDETSGATSDTWSSLFSGKAYEPYTLIPKNGMLTNDMFVDQVIGLAGVAISTDTYTGEKIVTIPASKEKQIFIPCEQMTCYLLEFYGKSNYVEFSSDYSKGAMLVLEFTDENYRVIGKITDSSAPNYGQLYKYNGCVLGKDARRYHRYGAVSPRGAKYIKLRVVTRTDTTIELSNVSLRPVHGYNGRQQNGIKIDGHLGCILTSPRNTMPSFEQAKIAGYNTVICNVKFTGDNPPIPVCIHDDTIDATSDGTGAVSSYTYEQLQTYDFGSYFDPVYTGTRIPKFEDVLAYFSSNGIRPAISIHSNQTSETLLDIIADLFKKHSVHNALIKSFNMSILSYMFSKLGDDAEYVWDFDLATPTEQNMTALTGIGAKRACVETSYDYCTQESINMAHAKGLEYSVSFSYDPAQIRELALRGIDRVCMDFFSDMSIPMN